MGFPTATHEDRVGYLNAIYIRANFDSIISSYALMMCAEKAGKTLDQAKELTQAYREMFYSYYGLAMRHQLKMAREGDDMLFLLASDLVKKTGVHDFTETQREIVFEHSKRFYS